MVLTAVPREADARSPDTSLQMFGSSDLSAHCIIFRPTPLPDLYSTNRIAELKLVYRECFPVSYRVSELVK